MVEEASSPPGEHATPTWWRVSRCSRFVRGRTHQAPINALLKHHYYETKEKKGKERIESESEKIPQTVAPLS